MYFNHYCGRYLYFLVYLLYYLVYEQRMCAETWIYISDPEAVPGMDIRVYSTDVRMSLLIISYKPFTQE